MAKKDGERGNKEEEEEEDGDIPLLASARASEALAQIWRGAALSPPLPESALGKITVPGDAAFEEASALCPSSHCLVEAAWSACAAVGLAASLAHRVREIAAAAGPDSESDRDAAAAALLDEAARSMRTVHVDPIACLAECLSERIFAFAPSSAAGSVRAPALWHPLSGLYESGDGRWVRLHCNFPHHMRAAVGAICAAGRSRGTDRVDNNDDDDDGNENDDLFAFGFLDDTEEGSFREPPRPIFERALRACGLTAAEIEDSVNARGGVAAMARTTEEWDAAPQAQAVHAAPLLFVRELPRPPRDGGSDRAEGSRLGTPCDASPRTPLAGTRVVDLTHILAGPVCTRILASYGAAVCRVSDPARPAVAVEDMGRGKTSAPADLGTRAGVARLEALCAEADVVVRGFRPGALEERVPILGGPCAPVSVDLSAFGRSDRVGGPWAQRRGFDSIVQTAAGFNLDEGAAADSLDHPSDHPSGRAKPRPFPFQAIDHTTGHLLAFATIACLALRFAESATRGAGGSTEGPRREVTRAVSGSLVRTGMWIRALGRRTMPRGGRSSVDDPVSFLRARYAREEASGFGPILAVSHAARIEGLPEPSLSLPSLPRDVVSPDPWVGGE